MDFGWIIWAALLVAWSLIGLGIAYLFGGWARRSEASGGAFDASKVHYLRRKKRASTSHRASTETKSRHAAGGRNRH